MKHFSLYYSLKALAFFSAGCSTGFTSVNHPVRLQILPPHCFKNRMRLRHCCGKCRPPAHPLGCGRSGLIGGCGRSGRPTGGRCGRSSSPGTGGLTGVHIC